MTPVENAAFGQFLRDKAGEARKLGYPPNNFLGMLNTYGAYDAAVQLLSKTSPSEGFTKLWDLKRLDLSLEALVVETKWRSHFDPLLVSNAERLLTKAGYKFLAFVPPKDVSKEAVGDITSLAAKPPSRRNSLSFSAFCGRLGAALKNPADRWCGISDERRLAVFTVWADRLAGGRYVYWNDETSPGDTRIGARELGRVLATVVSKDYSAYGILCEAADPSAEPRVRRYFDEETLLALRFVKEPPGIVAYVAGEVAADDVANSREARVRPFQSADDDLDVPPPGAEQPEKVSHAASGYRRDPAVRRYVTQRAQGRCEYCGELGFELASGAFYVEAHHVLALSARGPDTVTNVIALCPQHHRQAHFGRDADDLEVKFLAKLRKLQGLE